MPITLSTPGVPAPPIITSPAVIATSSAHKQTAARTPPKQTPPKPPLSGGSSGGSVGGSVSGGRNFCLIKIKPLNVSYGID